MKPENITVHNEKCVGCLRCELVCSQFYFEKYNPLKAWITIMPTASYEFQIDFTEDCTSCGLCAENCAFGALKLV